MFKKTVLVHALTLAFGGAVLAIGTMAPAMAQSNATSVVYGTVAPGADVRVVLENPATGLRRTVTPDAQGRFQATALPTGSYTVTQYRGDAVVGTTRVETSIGQNAEAVFAEAGVQTVEVTGQRRNIDVTSTSSGATFSARQLAALPVTRDIQGIIQLAPNTTRVDSRFSGGASFGGGAASENSYYINGFPAGSAPSSAGRSVASSTSSPRAAPIPGRRAPRSRSSRRAGAPARTTSITPTPATTRSPTTRCAWPSARTRANRRPTAPMSADRSSRTSCSCTWPVR
jgi:hypothetical protein